ncbi:DNA polymerase III subunit delta [Elusimicrobiota bacterium]
MPYIKSPEFYSKISKKDFSPVYIIAGEDPYEHDEALKYLEKTLSLDSLNREMFFGGETPVEEIILADQTMPFMGDKRLIIVKNAHKIRANDTDKLAEFLKNPVNTSCLVLFWVDRIGKDFKKKKLINAVEKTGSVVEFKRLYDNELPSWVQKNVERHGKKINNAAIQVLLEESGASLLDLDNEIEKLILFTGQRNEILTEDVEKISGHTKLTTLNNLSSVLESKNALETLKVVEELLKEGEVGLRILATISRVVRRLLIAKSLLLEQKKSQTEIRQSLRLHNYFDRNFFTNLSKFKFSDLEEGINLVLKADRDIKTSSRPVPLIFEELILSLCRYRTD